MKRYKRIHSVFSKLLSTAFIYASISYGYGETFDQCFPDKYRFICSDPYVFLETSGINVKENIINPSTLQKHKRKPTGHSSGGIFRDSHKTYFVKEKSNPWKELVGSKLMNLIVGENCTPVVKLLEGKPNAIASQKLNGFKMYKKLKSKSRTVTGAADLAIAMDFIGLGDRNPRNMGLVNGRLAARVDFDASFSFESNPRVGYKSNTNDHLNLKQLYLSIKYYPKDLVINAIRKIVDIPDEKIIMTLFQSWLMMSIIGHPIPIEISFALSQQLIERKNAFREAIENPDSASYQHIEKQYALREQLRAKQYPGLKGKFIYGKK